jgi:hypothetical protein
MMSPLVTAPASSVKIDQRNRPKRYPDAKQKRDNNQVSTYLPGHGMRGIPTVKNEIENDAPTEPALYHKEGGLPMTHLH